MDILSAMNKHGIVNSVILSGVPNGEFSPTDFALEGIVPLLDENSINNIKGLPFVANVEEAGSKLLDITVKGKKFEGINFLTLSKSYLVANNYIPEKSVFGKSKILISDNLAKNWGVAEGDVIQIETSRLITKQFEDLGVEFMNPTSLTIGHVAKVSGNGIEKLDRLVAIDRDYSSTYLTDAMLEKTEIIVSLSGNSPKYKDILNSFIENNTEAVISGTKVKVQPATDFFTPVLTNKDLSLINFWLSLSILFFVTVVSFFLEIGKYGVIRHETALRRTFGARYLDLIFRMLLKRIKWNLISIVLGVVVSMILLGTLGKLEFDDIYRSMLIIVAVYFSSILIPTVFIVKAYNLEPALVLSREY